MKCSKDNLNAHPSCHLSQSQANGIVIDIVFWAEISGNSVVQPKALGSRKATDLYLGQLKSLLM